MPKPQYVDHNSPRLTLQGARLIMAAAARRASALRVPMAIAVVDDAGHLLVFNRMDGAKLSSIDIAISKGWTAACARRATHEYSEIAGPGKPAYGIHMSNAGRFIILGGGLPIHFEGQVIGGIGCSSGTVQQDREVAMAGISALTWKASSPNGRGGTPPRRARAAPTARGRRGKPAARPRRGRR